ncbi:hypothetical protein AVI51_02520 [Piscirickettsia salmonis]|uniref:Uncharacterized protein n=2 Tax=Piscirickettsia salmonis TaxID=1238 RepID=A0A9Q5VD44_PISSA|nr:hypothetical protein [Piscirickettsia salmonis]ALA24938.1 hypothetical protein KW89_1470 [Piscirickettsia salmonis]APS45240.1 hypothetical protein AVI48_13225 [Piscirickettsia salmonis]APS48601.1 hypothetical protein AVI49_13835 [Piscirickettsia salmonis]APS49856.1 hypothetical protein AVI50_02560 [Piscirickettsia salmonis]APS53043.1 hypothetical protein AVI51_02520 [Piscirickettsia salmonis]
MKFLINQSLLLVIMLIAFTLVPITIVASEHATNRVNISAVAMQKVNEAQNSKLMSKDQEASIVNNTSISKQHKERPSGGFLALILLLIFIFVSTPILFIIWLSARRNK